MERRVFIAGLLATILLLSGCVSERAGFSAIKSGGRVSVDYDLRNEPESFGAVLLPPCEDSKPVLVLWGSVSVCYKEEVECEGVLRIEGVKKEFYGPCGKYPKDHPEYNKTCTWSYIEAGKITCK